MSSPVEVIARTLVVEVEQPVGEDVVVPREALQLAQAILFELGKAGVRLVEPGDVLHETRLEDKVFLTLKAEQ